MEEEVQTKSRPLPFSPAMARAYYADTKTQTRRVVVPQPEQKADGWHVATKPRSGYGHESTMRDLLPVYCPYGQPGDRLWVRETLVCGGNGFAYYECDGEPVLFGFDRIQQPWAWKVRKIVPRYMPRWACRSMAELLDVRVQRVQEIGLDDMRAEGVRPTTEASLLWRETLAENFRSLWDQINAKRGYGWASNPYVWALTFKRI